MLLLLLLLLLRNNPSGGRVNEALNPGPPDYNTSLHLIARFSIGRQQLMWTYINAKSHSVVALSRRRETTAKNQSLLIYIMTHYTFTRSINCFVITGKLTSKPNGLRISIKPRVKHALNVSWVLGRRRQPIVSDPFLSSDDVTPTM